MIPKEQRSKFLQKQLDDNEFTNSFNFIKRIKGLDSTAKLLLIDMCNDLYMNGSVTWAHQTYADRCGLSRRQVVRWFDTFVENNVLLPDANNKVGGRKNRFGINHNNFKNLIKSKQPVTPEVRTCDTDGIEPVTPMVTSCDTHDTYNKDNKDNKSLLSEENILDVSSVGESEMLALVDSLNLDI